MRPLACPHFPRSCRLTVPIAMFAVFVAADGVAQQVQQKQPQVSWTKLCDKVKTLTDDQGEGTAGPAREVNRCLTLREQLNQKTGQLVVSAAIRQQEGEDGEHLMVVMPLGVDLRRTLQARIDAGAPVKLDYARCNQIGCTADVQVTPDVVKAMKSGQQLVIQTTGPLGRPISFALALPGFAAAYDGKASDAKQYNEARQRLVSAIRARRAEQIKKAVQEMERQQQQQTQEQPQPQPVPQQ